MAGRAPQRVGDLDQLSTQQYHEIATGHDAAGWESQRQGFTELRDLSAKLATDAEQALTELRRDWSGGGAEAFAAEFGKLIDLFAGLRDSANTNAEGMRELATVMASARDSAEQLTEEDRSWESNRDGDDEATITAMREAVRGELRDRIKEADGSYQHLAQSFLLDPPQPPRLGGMETVARDLGSPDIPQSTHYSPTTDHSAAAPTLQSTAHHTAAAPPAETPPPTAPPPAEAPPPAPMPPMGGMGGMGMGGHIAAGSGGSGSAPRSDGPRFREGRAVEASLMRSNASRQDLHNQTGGPRPRRADPEEERRAVKAADADSPFAPTDTPVVPPVISGGTEIGPHESGPVLTGTVYRHYPEYGREEPEEVFTENYEDGSSAVVEFGDDTPDLTAPPPPTATARDDAAQSEVDRRLLSTRVDGDEYLKVLQSLPRDKAPEFIAAQAKLRRAETADPAPDQPTATPAEPQPRKRVNLAELRRRRAERRKNRG